SKSEFLFQDQGKISIIAGTLSFEKITLIINSTAAAEVEYIIAGTTEQTEIKITDCLMRMQSITTSYSIKVGLVELSVGKLTISKLDVKDITIASYSIIKVNSGSGIVDISESKFNNISRTGASGKGSVLQVEFNSYIGKLIMSEVTMNQCSAKNGGAIYSSLIEGSSMIIKDSSSFSECKSIAGNGGAMYIDIDLTSQSKFELIDTTFQSCQSKDSTPPSSSTSPFGFGGAIFITAQGQYDPLKNGKALKGALFDSNSALNGGQNLYVVMQELIQFCRTGEFGEYVKGNYIDQNQNKSEIYYQNKSQLEGISKKYYWEPPPYLIWHILDKIPDQGQNYRYFNGGAIYIILNGGSFVMKETQMYNCTARQGGAVYALISSMNQFLINEEVYFEECEAFSSNQSQGRGGAIYLNVGQDAPYEFTVGVNLHFNLNKASQYGRDLFIHCKNIIVMKPDRRILYDMLNETYDKDNAIFGTEYAQESELGRPQMIDFDILSLMLPYYNDIIYISQDQSISENTLKCGRIYLPCVTLSYAEGKVFTPEWTAETVPQDSSGDQQINYTYIIFQGIEVTLPFETEVNNVIIREFVLTDDSEIKTSGGIYIGIIDSGSEWVAISQKRIIDKLQEQGLNYKTISRKINDICRPSIIFDICVIKECKTTKSGLSSTIPTLESGGVILHSEKSQTRCNFNSTPNDPTLLQNTPFESLWLREKEFGVEGSGMIVAYGRTMPSIKADGIQFIGCDAVLLPPSQDISHLFSQTNYKFINNHFTIKLLFGRFSSQTVILKEQILVLKGQGEEESILVQKNISQTLFILQNSQLKTSYLSAQLWVAEASLIRSQGNGMSIIDGLRVIGVKQERIVVHCSVFEVISGELGLIDIQIKDINISENYNEINSVNKRKNMMKGLIEMKENAKVLYFEKFIITNINIENINKEQRMSSIMMNAGHLKLRDGAFLGEAYTSIGSAIRAQPTGPSTIDVKGVLFKGQGYGQGTNGGAVYVDMRTFDVQMSFKRCIFIGNKADYGSNVFICYAYTSQRINKNSFIGCTSIAGNSYEQDISVCYSIGGNDDEIFIDERNLIHSSWNRQKSEGVVRFISNPDANHKIDSSLKCGSVSKPCNTYQTLIEYIQLEPESDGLTGRVETLIFGEGKISSPFIDLSLARSDIINIVGCGDQLTEIYPQQSSLQAMIYGGFNQIIVIERVCIANSPASPLIGFIKTQGAEAGLVMQDMRVQGYLETSPYNTMLEPPYLFSIEGFVHLQDVIFEH
ncbi:MAG: hypothetical protein EZS28_021313, partial [Streblomastix strix]